MATDDPHATGSRAAKWTDIDGNPHYEWDGWAANQQRKREQRNATRDRAARDYKQIEYAFRGLLWEQFPGATTNQVHDTARKLADLTREANDD